VMVRCDREQSAFVGSNAPTSSQLNRPDAAGRRIEVVAYFGRDNEVTLRAARQAFDLSCWVGWRRGATMTQLGFVS